MSMQENKRINWNRKCRVILTRVREEESFQIQPSNGRGVGKWKINGNRKHIDGEDEARV